MFTGEIVGIIVIVAVMVIVGEGVGVGVAGEGVASGVMAYVNQGLIVEGGVGVSRSVSVGVAENVGDPVKFSVGVTGVRFGCAVPVLLGLGLPIVLVGVGDVFSGCVAV